MESPWEEEDIPDYDSDGIPAVNLFSDYSDDDRVYFTGLILRDPIPPESWPLSPPSSDSSCSYIIHARRADGTPHSESNHYCDSSPFQYFESDLDAVPKLRLHSELSREGGSNWRVFSSIMENCLAGMETDGIFLDDVIFNAETGKEPLCSGQEDEQVWQTSLDKWAGANSHAHSAIMCKLPAEFHDVGKRFPKAADLWNYLTTYFNNEGHSGIDAPPTTDGTPAKVVIPLADLATTSEEVPKTKETVTVTPSAAALGAVPPATSASSTVLSSATSGRGFCEAADSTCDQSNERGKADADNPEAHSQDKHPNNPSPAAKTGSSSKWQLSEVHHMSFDCVNLGLWMTSTDIWQLEGLHNFMVLT